MAYDIYYYDIIMTIGYLDSKNVILFEKMYIYHLIPIIK